MKRVTIDGILGGRAPARFAPGKGQFSASIGVDPDLPIYGNHASGMAVPSGTEQVGSVILSGRWVVAVITNPKDDHVYFVLSDGKLFRSTDFSLDNVTLVGDTLSAASGGAYYNNYIYVINAGNVSRYGPLDGAAFFATSFWTANLGLTALNVSPLPRFRSAEYPSHPTLVHTDGCLYFGDLNSSGQGILNKLSTQSGGGVQGRDNSTTAPSAYNVLDLPFNCRVTSLASYSTTLAVSTLQSTAVEDVSQGQSYVFFWDAVSDSFDQQVAVPDQWCTALAVRYGKLTAFTGSGAGFRVAEFVGGSTFAEVAYVEDGMPPTHYGVDVAGRRLVFGSFCTQPTEIACVWAMGSRSGGQYDVQNVMPVGGTGARVAAVTALRYVKQVDGIDGQYGIGMKEQDGLPQDFSGIYKRSASLNLGVAGTNALVLPVVAVGRRFRIDRIRLPFVKPVGAATNMLLTVIYDGLTEEPLQPITFANVRATRYRTFKTAEMTGAGWHDFQLKVEWLAADGDLDTEPTPLAFPVEVWLEAFDDEPLFEAA